MMSCSLGSPPTSHIWLFLESNSDNPEGLYLEIPLECIRSICLKPGKYLRFLAYAILAVDGTIAQLSGQTTLADESQLEDGGIYIFCPGEYSVSCSRTFLNCFQPR